MKKALIIGVSGQDGSYLAHLLLEKGYEVLGGSRDAQASSFANLHRLGIRDDLQKVSININDFRSTLQTIIRYKPDEIYNLAGQTSVGLSFEQPVETLESIVIGNQNILEAIRFSGLNCRYYNAGSSEAFGDTGSEKANEETPFRPRSPYGVAKATAFWQVANYRDAYQLQCATGILFNHESPLRPERFVTQKIIGTVCRIANGSSEKLVLGNIEIARDWGWAPEYVDAMWRIVQQEKMTDFVIATGKTVSLRYFIEQVFSYFGLDWQEYVEIDSSLFRPSDPLQNFADVSKAKSILNWEARMHIEKMVQLMIESKLKQGA